MDEAEHIGEVLPRYGALRRAVLPIYGIDQLLFVAIVALPFVWLASVDPRLARYVGVGAYIGFVITMQRSTPSSLVLPARDHQRVAAILDRSSFFKPEGNSEWNSTKGRLRRWDTDNIQVERNGQTVRVTGRQIDLQKIAAQLAS